MSITTLTNYDPRFGLSIAQFDGKWGFYIDLGSRSVVVERTKRKPCAHELGAKYADGRHVCLDCGANMAQDYVRLD